MKLALDVDDVLLDFGTRILDTVNMEYGATLKIEDVTSWNLSELLDPILGEDWWAWWEERDWLWANAKAVPGAIGGLRRLHQQGHYIQLITAKPYWARKGLNQWLGKWNPYFDELIVGSARPPMEKHLVSDALVLVDDKPDNVESWAGTGRIGLLFSRPHNLEYVAPLWEDVASYQLAPFPKQVTRVRNWAQVLDAINAIEEALEVTR